MGNNPIDTNDYLIGEKPFFSIFLQIKSGYEERIIDDLINTISKIIMNGIFLDIKHFKILKCLGHFDVAIIPEMDKMELTVESFEKISQKVSQIDYITDSNNIVGYSWENNLNFKGEDICWGISSIKLDLDDVTSPIKIEKDIAKKIMEISNKSNIKVQIFGSLGWNEIILFINSSSLDDISKFVYDIRIFHHVLDISTIPAVLWGCWDNKTLECVPNCQILITHRSRTDYPIRELLFLIAEKNNINIYNEDVGLIFGGFDIRVPIVNTELDNIIKFVLELRKITTITRTNTILSSMQIPSADIPLSQINMQNYFLDLENINFIQEDIKFNIIHKNNLIYILENEIRHLRQVYTELKRDDYTSSLYFNLDDFFEDVDLNIKRAKNHGIKNFDEKRGRIILLEQLKKIIQTFEFSIYQRISGIQMSYLMEAKQTGFEKFGGIQRIALAIETIPREIINNITKKDWKGFCVFGSEPDFICQNIGEVISIPFEYKNIPEKWWGLGHEIGHLLINKERDQIFTSTIKDAIEENFENDIKIFRDNLGKTNVYEKEQFLEYRNRELEFIRENIEEICADYLNFKIIFSSDWKSFLKCTLHYLDDRGYDILSETRLFRIISLSEHINKNGIEKDKELFPIIKNIMGFKTYDELHFRDRLDIIKNQTFFPYLETVDQILNGIDNLFDISVKDDILKEIDLKLNKGEVLENNSNLNVIYILKSLINRDLNDNINFRYQITSILSLYNSRFSK